MSWGEVIVNLVQSLERELKDTRASLLALNSEKKQLLEDADELMARKASLEIAVGELETKVEEEKVTKVRDRSKLWLMWYVQSSFASLLIQNVHSTRFILLLYLRSILCMSSVK